MCLEISFRACVYRNGARATLTFILSLCVMLEISCGACVYRYGARAILTFVLKDGACVWCWRYYAEPVSIGMEPEQELSGWSLCLMLEILCGACVYRYGARAILTFILKDGACV